VITDVLDMSRLESGRFQIQKTDFEIDTAVSAAVAEIAAIATEKEISVVAEPCRASASMPITRQLKRSSRSSCATRSNSRQITAASASAREWFKALLNVYVKIPE